MDSHAATATHGIARLAYAGGASGIEDKFPLEDGRFSPGHATSTRTRSQARAPVLVAPMRVGESHALQIVSARALGSHGAPSAGSAYRPSLSPALQADPKAVIWIRIKVHSVR